MGNERKSKEFTILYKPSTHWDKSPELLLSFTKSGLVKDCFPINEKNYSLFIPRSADSDQLN